MTFKEAVKSVTAAHVRAALAEIDKRGIPKNGRSRGWCLKVDDRRYPPKYVFAEATKQATNHTLSPDAHSGGKPTNEALRKLGFTVEICREAATFRSIKPSI